MSGPTAVAVAACYGQLPENEQQFQQPCVQLHRPGHMHEYTRGDIACLLRGGQQARPGQYFSESLGVLATATQHTEPAELQSIREHASPSFRPRQHRWLGYSPASNPSLGILEFLGTQCPCTVALIWKLDC